MNAQPHWELYRCDAKKCKRSFDTKVSLKCHLESDHSGRVLCGEEDCNTSFKRSQDMKRHVANLHRDGKETCLHCGSRMRKDKLKGHENNCPPTLGNETNSGTMAGYDVDQVTFDTTPHQSNGTTQTTTFSYLSSHIFQGMARAAGTTGAINDSEYADSWVDPFINYETGHDGTSSNSFSAF
ncbi:hypothetical protein G7Y89_g14380 [Cudoniella acicularis]|uniref:C2H2-type domain-containing protein n=1 Tax=Cudoniella acicularis TaxID=354080 RepID=A0A8H4R226_9HELO|nr:hypothetical protein G7Y89_g14380 [Cudoniella acicularis]